MVPRSQVQGLSSEDPEALAVARAPSLAAGSWWLQGGSWFGADSQDDRGEMPSSFQFAALQAWRQVCCGLSSGEGFLSHVTGPESDFHTFIIAARE